MEKWSRAAGHRQGEEGTGTTVRDGQSGRRLGTVEPVPAREE